MKPLLLAGGVLACLTLTTTPVQAAEQSAQTEANVKIVADDSADQLTLTSAPDFDFGTVKALDIYNGFAKDHATVTQPLTVVDGRKQESQGGWHLTTTLSAFKNGTDTLNQATLSLATTAAAPVGMALAGATTTGTAQTVLTHDTGRGTLTLPATAITASLDQTATPDATVAADAQYSAELNWTLTGNVAAQSL